ncbi:BamA/TamA family outer membrane protein [Riemerella columbipharyngis]|uniref:Outer membrane translocation and assembly module TamA n=1 Tax=Riemerella columbipharyngis TaxID=1071918 RepID=A0A1G7BP16_9FLAO|nr:hypothetical protein [Riemerella columbipharyngis]SDE28672.1 hypothetical protein SAMN05421544_10663 [Riemerella columbipharyngis]
MERKFWSVLLFLVYLLGTAQGHRYFLIDAKSHATTQVKDSLSAVHFLDSLSQYRYYLTRLQSVEQKRDSVKIYYDKGQDFNRTQVVLPKDLSVDLGLESGVVVKDLDSLRLRINDIYKQKGYAFNRIKSRFLGMERGVPKVGLSVVRANKRTIDGFVIRDYNRVPRRFVKNLEKEFVGQTYDDRHLLKIRNALANHTFVTLERNPQTLFTKDSTQIYLFLKKKKANTFDGVLGFGNNNSQKFQVTGSISLNFKNIFNGFESVSLFWQRNPNSGQNFDMQADVPYLFNSNIGVNLHTNIFRQDSTFANVKVLSGAYFQFSPRQKVGIRGHLELSSVSAANLSTARNFKRKGFGVWYEFQMPIDNPLMLYKTKIKADADLFNTIYDDSKIVPTKQYQLFAEHNLQLADRNFINAKIETAALDTKEVLSVNELFRIGGWNSLRGFDENILLSKFYVYGGLEYRYIIGETAFFDVFGQMGKLKNPLFEKDINLYSGGFGFNFILPVGLMSFQISNGNNFEDRFNFKNTKVHWGLLSRF